MIQFANVSKYFGAHEALKNVDFTLESGEMAFLTGHSGAGKSTLLKLIMLIERTHHGQVWVDGRNVTQYSRRQIPALRQQIGMIFQSPKLLENRTVFENVALPLIISRYKPADVKRRVRAALEKVGLPHKEKKFPAALSAGEQQRVGIARAVVTKPSIILADEPTGNLDPSLSLEIIRLFEAFNGVGVTVLVATHDLALIAPLNHRIMTLKEGRLVL